MDVGKTIRVLYKRVTKMNESALASAPALKSFGDAHIATHFRKFGINSKTIVLTPVEGRDFIVQWQGFIKGMEAQKEKFEWARGEQQRQCERLVHRLKQELEQEIVAGKAAAASAASRPQAPVFTGFGPLTYVPTRAISQSTAPAALTDPPSGNLADVMLKLGGREFTRGELLFMNPARLVALYQKLSDEMRVQDRAAEDKEAVNAVIEEAGSEADWHLFQGGRNLALH